LFFGSGFLSQSSVAGCRKSISKPRWHTITTTHTATRRPDSRRWLADLSSVLTLAFYWHYPSIDRSAIVEFLLAQPTSDMDGYQSFNVLRGTRRFDSPD